MTNTAKNIQMIPFSGKREDWNQWSKMFLVTDENIAANSKLNIQVYSYLMMSCEDEVSFAVIDESVSTNFPNRTHLRNMSLQLGL